jgi:XTP/dITP diphosphohydrolase
MTLALQRLLIATTNAGKLRDFAVAAGGHLEIVPLPGLNAIAAPAEDEPTFEGNARVKAIYYSRFAPGEIVLADDSGLEVDALNGAPGVRSARYAEDLGFVSDEPIDTRNNLCLMAALRETPANARQARYRCVLAAARDGEVIAIGSGSVEGTILAAAQGTGGFGYDPFFLPIGETQSMAELDSARRMTLSHRGRALKALVSGLMDRDDTSTT